jgi:hypothetical protein
MEDGPGAGPGSLRFNGDGPGEETVRFRGTDGLKEVWGESGGDGGAIAPLGQTEMPSRRLCPVRSRSDKWRARQAKESLPAIGLPQVWQCGRLLGEAIVWYTEPTQML